MSLADDFMGPSKPIGMLFPNWLADLRNSAQQIARIEIATYKRIGLKSIEGERGQKLRSDPLAQSNPQILNRELANWLATKRLNRADKIRVVLLLAPLVLLELLQRLERLACFAHLPVRPVFDDSFSSLTLRFSRAASPVHPAASAASAG